MQWNVSMNELVDFLTWKYNEKRHGGEQEKVSKIEIKDQYK